MNKITKLALFALSFLLLVTLSCTSETELIAPAPGPDPGVDEANLREVQLTFKSKLNLQSKTTRASGGTGIATTAENFISKMDIYIFGSLTEAGPYTLQEVYCYNDDPTVALPGDWAKTLNLLPNPDKDDTYNCMLRLKKGLFVKIYCVANRTTLYQTAADGTVSAYTGWKALEYIPGEETPVLTPGVPTETDFLKLHTAEINPAGQTSDDILSSPLPMTGAYTTPLDLTDMTASARTQIGFKMTRMVARFDIHNEAAKSRFTLQSVSLANGRKGAVFFSMKPLGSEVAVDGDLVTYPARLQEPEVEGDPLPDKIMGAFYSWPAPKQDQAYLILNGEYKVNETETQPVSYKVPFEQIQNGSGSFIEVNANHRYMIAITNADPYQLQVNISVSDWTDEGDLDDYTPENDFDKANIVLLNDAGQSVNAYVNPEGNVILLPVAASKFAFAMSSNAEISETLTFDGGDAWLVMENTRTKAAFDSTFTYQVSPEIATMTDLRPATIRLVNPASGKKKEIRVLPAAGPDIELKSASSFSSYNPATSTVILYNLKDEFIELTATAETRVDADGNPLAGGSSVDNSDCSSWLAVTPAASSADAKADYMFKVSQVQSSIGDPGTLVFTSTVSGATTTVKVQLKDTKIKTPKAEGFGNGGNSANSYSVDGGTGGIPKVTLSSVAGNHFSLNVISPEGILPEVSGGTDWLEIYTSDQKMLSGGLQQITLTGTIKADATGLDTAKADGVITLKNLLIGGGDMNIEVVTTVVTPPAP